MAAEVTPGASLENIKKESGKRQLEEERSASGSRPTEKTYVTLSQCSSSSISPSNFSNLSKSKKKKLQSELEKLEAVLRQKCALILESSDSSEGDRDSEQLKSKERRTSNKSLVTKWIDDGSVAGRPASEPLAEPEVKSTEYSKTKLADIASVPTTDCKCHTSMCHTQNSRDTRLPPFDGNTKDWLIFKATYDETTTRHRITAVENVSRLRLALKGEARAAVSAPLYSCADPKEVMDILQLRFGHPSKILREQISEIRSLKPVSNEPNAISEFSCKISNCCAAIKALDRSDYFHSAELYELIVSKLSPILKSRWANFAAEHVELDSSRLSCLSSFLRQEAENAMRFLPEAAVGRPPTAPTPTSAAAGSKRYSVNTSNVSASSGKPKQCLFCSEVDHNVARCSKFIELTENDRYDWAKTNKICFRCLMFSHPAKNCKISRSKYLHRLLKRPAQNNDENVVDNFNPVLTTHQTLISDIGALLKVVPVTVHGPKGTVKTFALLDGGASISLIDARLAARVGADGDSDDLAIRLLGSTRRKFSSKSVQVKLESSTGSSYDIKFRTMPNLNLQTQFLCKDSLIAYPHIAAVQHDISWFENGTPEMIVGQNYPHLIVPRRLHEGKDDEPMVSETLLGFVVHGCRGNFHAGSNLSHSVTIAHACVDYDDELHGLIKESFKLDSLGLESKTRSNPEVDRAVELLERNTRKIDSTTWETGLLWKKDDEVFPDTHGKALKRFYSLEHNFQKNPEFAKGYSLQMKRLLDLKFAEPYIHHPDCQVEKAKRKEWILSHFAAFNPNKPKKVRIVCDCADKIFGKSLNDYLLTGPDLLQSLLGVLWRFRRAPVAVVGDIKDMFLKIKIRKEDQEFQKFYWRELGDQSPPKLYVMSSMLFGAKCSHSSAIYVINRNADDFKTEYPETVKAIHQNHYCDDYLDSFKSEKEAIDTVATVINIHAQGNFDICNWVSNSEAVLQSIPEEKRGAGAIQLAHTDPSKERTLGMMWAPSSDTLSFNLSMKRVSNEVSSGQVKPTKRQMLAVLMSVFDPIGLLSHFTIRGRILLQEVWRSGISWDSELQENEFIKWKQWLGYLQVIRDCSIPRCYVTRTDDAIIQLHTFCDASSQAYAAACYLRYRFKDDVHVVLVAAKARVTPLKPCSIPRLELQGAVLGAKLAKAVQTEIQLPIIEKFYWSDSITTLAWIRSDPRNYKPFVGHRLAAIDELSSASEWKWVPTALNPADIATRDNKKLDVSLDGPWFSAPDFLKKEKEEWPEEKTKIVSDKEALCEEKHAVNVIQLKEYNLPDIVRFSSWKRLINSTAYIFLYLEKLKIKCNKEGFRELNMELLEKAEKEWIKKAQEEDFSEEILCLKEKRNLPHNSKLLQLSPMLNEDRIITLRGRIDRTPDVPLAMKRPVVLSGGNPYTKLLIHHYHKLFNHSSTETVVNEMRQKYWILKLRSSIRSVAHTCQFCKVQRAAAAQPPQGDLPFPRLQHHIRAFSFCALDYFGPVEISIGRRREKRWGALFTCLVTRAVHMEVAANMTADSVIMAIRRMSARRGSPTAIYSDNGTNFKGADVELQKAWSEVDKEAISSDMLNRGIDWHFIPATAAHMGGAWERMVQSIKKALRAILHERAPKEEVFSTLITEAEQSVNSRPLTFVSVDPRDPEALTPYHFLIGSSSAAPVPGKFDDKDLLLRKQWKVAQRLADMFWSRWIREYLPTLLDRKMKGTKDQEIKEGQLVIIVDSHSPRNVWPRGVISKTFPGEDGKIRVVEVRTVGGVFRRPVNKVIILPVVSQDVGSSGTNVSANCLQNFLSRLA